MVCLCLQRSHHLTLHTLVPLYILYAPSLLFGGTLLASTPALSPSPCHPSFLGMGNPVLVSHIIPFYRSLLKKG
ncbi:hypothetical protein QBC46DRAFT_392282 [Diplogelasinospora grovesii]|uniref:Uncharacterized protein n=1 Tax=Diplogelasinospora grovesii TaxID=303347 RepID=A0AAN6N2M0_9PEZI|nr:hypothetical protein QBC46DRAFT_392282 [Diplogelasinospora grovesii]